MKKVKTFCLLLLMAVIIWNPTRTCHYALEGLTQWATRMVPTLFPFMILSSLMLHCGTGRQLGEMLTWICRPFATLNPYSSYAVFMGFLCGFPMGAKVVSELYQAHQISRQKAQILVGFCNNIGPAYFLGLVFPMLQECGYGNLMPFLFGMYGIPLLYGIVLCRIYARRDKVQPPETCVTQDDISAAGGFSKICMDNIQAILLLGGYVTFINALRGGFDYLPCPAEITAVISSFLEIIGGIPAIYQSNLTDCHKAFWIMVTLSFNGISCMLQACSFLEKAKLSISHYIINKLVVLACSVFYYGSIILLPIYHVGL